MRRREFILLVGYAAVASSIQGHAQQSGKTYRVGLLTNGPVIGPTDERRKSLVSALATQGFIEGQNLIFEQRSANLKPRQLDGLVGELNAAKVDVIVTFGYPAALAAKNAAGATPVVVTGAGAGGRPIETWRPSYRRNGVVHRS